MDVAARASGRLVRATLEAAVDDPREVARIAALCEVPDADFEGRVSLPRPAVLWQEIIKSTGNPHAPLRSAARMPLEALGSLLPLLMKGQTLGTALHVACQFSSLVHDRAQLEVSARDGLAAFTVRSQIVSPARYLSEFILALSYRVMRIYVAGFSLNKVTMPHALAEPREAYEEHFGCPVEGRCGEGTLFFPERFLESPAATPDEASFLQLHQEATVLDSAQRADDALAHRIEATYCVLAGRDPALDFVAMRAGTEEDVLERVLMSLGRTHEDMCDWAKERVAKRMLCDDVLEVGEISERLGYDCADALAADFERWTGLGPSDWRREHGRT